MKPFSIADPAFLADPFTSFDELRGSAPVFEVSPGMFLVTRYDDVKWVLRDYEAFSAHVGENNAFALFGPSSVQAEIDEIFRDCPEAPPVLMRRDPPYQQTVRNAVSRLFTPRQVNRMVPRITEIIDELLAPWIHTGRVELVSEFAAPLPSAVTAEALGASPEHWDMLKRGADASVSRIAGPQEPETQLQVARDVAAVQRYFLELIEERRERPGDDLISHWVTAELEDGRSLEDAEIINLGQTFLVGGNETTNYLISSSFHRLVDDGALAQTLRDRPDRIPIFVEEMLRLESPAQGQPRGVTRDVEISGVLVPAGSTVIAMYSAANRDGDAFPHPNALDLDRKPERGCPHMAFGFANHFCLGATLARTEARLVLETLLPRMHDLALAPDDSPVRTSNFMLRGFGRLPLRFTPTS